MRIAIEISHLNHEKLSGVGVYTLELIKALLNISSLELVPVYRPSRIKHLSYYKNHLKTLAGANQLPPQISAWLFESLGLGGFNLGVDVIHGPDFRVSRAWKAKRVASIMDLAFLEPGMTSPEFAKKKREDLNQLLDIHTPDALIAISQATADALIDYRPNLKNKVHTVLLGGDHFSIPREISVKKEGNYFLFVGNLEARKNVLGIISAFETFSQKNQGYELILVGKPGYGSDEILTAIEKSPVKRFIKVIGYTTSSDLQAYYQGAIALVYPSWIEGFGIPVIEAMQLGCPVITSSTTSTAEIIGTTGWAVDPANTLGISEAMLEVANLKHNALELSNKVTAAMNQAKQFSWKKCAEQTAQVYQQVVKQGY